MMRSNNSTKNIQRGVGFNCITWTSNPPTSFMSSQSSIRAPKTMGTRGKTIHSRTKQINASPTMPSTTTFSPTSATSTGLTSEPTAVKWGPALKSLLMQGTPAPKWTSERWLPTWKVSTTSTPARIISFHSGRLTRSRVASWPPPMTLCEWKNLWTRCYQRRKWW